MFGVNPTELIVVFLIILILFGGKKIPEIAHGIGKGISEFKKAARDDTPQIDTTQQADDPSRRIENKTT
jgi:sec-independent protein translocase protein TatA